jgi:hypothetical protein
MSTTRVRAAPTVLAVHRAMARVFSRPASRVNRSFAGLRRASLHEADCPTMLPAMRGPSANDVTGIGWRAPAGLLASVLVHGLVLLTLTWSTSAPPVDFELTLPANVEFGVIHAAAVEAPAAPAAPDPAAPEPAAPDAPVEGPKPKPKKPKKKPKPEPDAGVDAGTDAGMPDAATPKPEAPPAPEPVASADAGTRDQAKPALAAFAPEGAQIALRLHLGALRESPLAEDVRGLLEAIPDWRLIVDGSGLDPLRDLERLFLATPNLSRSSLVVAGQYVGDETLPRKAVASLAAARGVKARWTRRGGMAIAPWPNADATARTVALIAPEQFVITRPEDLPRVLLVAKALSARAKQAGGKEPDPGAALLALGEGQTLVLSVEGARLFAQGNLAGVPERLEVSVSALPDNQGFSSVSTGDFESAEQASAAKAYWTRMRDRYASHPLVALVGMREPLVQMELETKDAQLVMRTQVTIEQARMLLGFARSALPPAPSQRLSPRPQLAPSAPAPGTPPASPNGSAARTPEP